MQLFLQTTFVQISFFLRSKLICQNEKPLKRRTYKCITTVINKESIKFTHERKIDQECQI